MSSPGHEMVEEQRLSQRFLVSSVHTYRRCYAPVYIGLPDFQTAKADNQIKLTMTHVKFSSQEIFH